MQLKEMINMKPLQVTKGSDLGHALWRTLRSYRADAADPGTRGGMRFRNFSSDALLRGARQGRAYITSSAHPSRGYSTLQPTKLSKKLINNQMKRMRKRNPYGYYPMVESTNAVFNNLMEGKFTDAVGKLWSNVKNSKLGKRAFDHAVTGTKEIKSNTANLFDPTMTKFAQASGVSGHAALRGSSKVAKKMGLQSKYTILTPRMSRLVTPGSHVNVSAPDLLAAVGDSVMSRQKTPLQRDSFHGIKKAAVGGFNQFANRAAGKATSALAGTKLGKRIGHDRMQRMIQSGKKLAGDAANVADKAASSKIGGALHRMARSPNAYYMGKVGPDSPKHMAMTVGASAAAVAPSFGENPISAGIHGGMAGATMGAYDKYMVKSLLHHPHKQIRKSARKIYGGQRHIIGLAGAMKPDLGVLSHELGHARNAERMGGNGIGAHVFRTAAPKGLGVVGEEAMASYRAKKAMRAIGHRGKTGLQLPLHSYLMSNVLSQRESTDVAFNNLMEKEQLKGGLGDNKPDRSFPSSQLRRGVKVEMEHTNNPRVAKEIAKDHLTEIRDYYTRLAMMERRAKKGS